MKIAMIVNSYPPRVGGLEQHLQNLAMGLGRLGNDVTVMTISEEPSSREDGHVRVLTGRAHFPIAGVISFPSLGTTRRLTRFLESQKFDVVSVHTRFFPMSFVGHNAAHRAGLPVIHTEHGSGHVSSASPIVSLGSRAVDNTLGRFVLSSSERVLGVSEEATVFAGSLGASNPQVFYNAISPRISPPNVVDRPNHLVFVGRIVPGKGWETFLETVAALRLKGLDVQGSVLGDGVDLSRAKQLIETLGLDSNVELLGRVSSDEVRRQISGSTLVNPTVLSEGFQTTLLEALAEGGRVVTFEVPGAALLRSQGMPVMITKEKTTESLITALEMLINDPPSLASEESISHWTWDVRAAEYSRIVKEVLESFKSFS